jgi:hypothetical protein
VSSGVRLLGVSASNLVEDAARQLTLDERGGWDDATSAVDAVRARFGDEAVGPATTLGDGGLRVKRLGAQQWGPDTVDGAGDR